MAYTSLFVAALCLLVAILNLQQDGLSAAVVFLMVAMLGNLFAAWYQWHAE